MSNDLIQHPEMSAVARILGIYIQSLPTGTPIGIKDLVKQLPLGETSIANGLRELVAFGYLERSLESLPGGRIVTRTVSFNHPRAAAISRPAAPAAPAAAAPDAAPEPAPEPAPDGPAEPGPVGAASTPRARHLPAPRDPDNPGRRRLAVDLLAELRRSDARLLLGERDIQYLAGGVEAWLERGAGVHALVGALTGDLPHPLRNPAGFIAHRLAAQLPPPLVPLPRAPAFVPPDPFQICPTCQKAFRSPAPGTCNGCGPPSG
ncbi:helix-turn-helix domain-containing protein [Streptomyces sp. 4.24]|uniref:helix-turn-helix domain-containing protein n=1 Tax=Streptomyces tritrimontium TaxID=3406573 RepID=UPI003BB50153